MQDYLVSVGSTYGKCRIFNLIASFTTAMKIRYLPYIGHVAGLDFVVLLNLVQAPFDDINTLPERTTTWLRLLGWLCLALCLQYCHPSVDPLAKGVADKKISQFEIVGYCDLLIDKAGTYHVVFQENPAIGKLVFLLQYVIRQG